ncbi:MULTISPECIES: hypothetical protein [unclassified Pseudomonas]|uniref:hypothetical protein n=1 Tax=unclassified Pseudomonas TaxID=196821 RepID=UPI000CD07A9E|nr:MULTISPECIES: hypothetical protein [unclassified Pseudomonas]POA52087.1 hypothetical protein C1889_24125 [Pseudomonas sp. FW507-12TSA]
MSNETISVQLLPCPFCGKAPRHVPADYIDHSGQPWPFAECDPCSVGAPVEFWNKRALLAQPAEPVDWTVTKPVSTGAYWIRGNGLEREALIEVVEDDGELRCNLHQRTTESDFGYGYSIEQLSDEFEWRGPLYTHPGAQPAAVALPTKEDFKTWADRRAYDLSHSDKGIFHNIDTREAWACFKAGADAAARLNPPQQ